MKAVVVGASGYSGGELLRLLDAHPNFQIHGAIAHSQAGELIANIHPHLISSHSGKFAGFDANLITDADLVFFALPHGESGKILREYESVFTEKKIVDLGADFRLVSAQQWEKYYGGIHFGSWQYGLPEIPGAREAIRVSSRIANPGCYATAITLSILPFVKLASKVDFSDIVVAAASGTTGAGRSAKINLIGSEVMNSLSAYKVGGVHQHTPEIEQAITSLLGSSVSLSFTPILAPMPRGILATVSVPVENSSSDELGELFDSSYAPEKFVHVLQRGQWPQTNSLIGSNGIQIQVIYDDHANRAVVIAAIDNLGKGAAGQALQNANLIAGFSEDAGLTSIGTR